jgi:hypothetical protein
MVLLHVTKSPVKPAAAEKSRRLSARMAPAFLVEKCQQEPLHLQVVALSLETFLMLIAHLPFP